MPVSRCGRKRGRKHAQSAVHPLVISVGLDVRCRGSLPWRGGSARRRHTGVGALAAGVTYGLRELAQGEKGIGVVLTRLGIGRSRGTATPTAGFRAAATRRSSGAWVLERSSGLFNFVRRRVEALWSRTRGQGGQSFTGGEKISKDRAHLRQRKALLAAEQSGGG
jgi:hypothetical protein